MWISCSPRSTRTNQRIHDWTLPRGVELWTEFSEVMRETDKSVWLYGGGQDKDRPAELGCFIGYRIVQTYYENIGESPAVIRAIIEMIDPQEFLKASGYTGM